MLKLYRYMSSEYANAFIERGEVLFRALSFFRDYEDEGIRADELEGTLIHRPKDGLKIRYVNSGEEVTIPYTFESTAREDDIFIYCMSTECSDLLASRFKASACVEVFDISKFILQLQTALAKKPSVQEEGLVHDKVKYYELHEPPIVDWGLPERIALRKPILFEWQHEYRFAFPIGSAFAVENVKVKLVPLGIHRPKRTQPYPKMLLELGNLSNAYQSSTGLPVGE